MNRQPKAVAAVSAVALFLTALPAAAAEVTLTLDAPEVDALSVIYRCEGTTTGMTVEYYNAGEDSFAMVPADGARRLMVTVLAASGARYAGGPFVWWTKGREGSLYDLRNGDDADPVAICVEEQ